MGEILFTFAVEQLLEKVGAIAIEEIAGHWRLDKDLLSLSELTQTIHGKVQEARNNQVANGQAVKPLLVKLQDVLYYAEDVLDEFSYEILRREIEMQCQPRLMVCCISFASHNNPILFRLKMAHKVKKINQSLADIEKQGLRQIAFTGKAVADLVVVSNDQLDRVTVSFFDKSAPPIIGRANEVKAIINMLQVSSSTPSPLTIISIVGFGGLGKTTLAKMVLRELKTTKLFNVTMWVCVSEPFDVHKILQGMLETLDENAGGLNNVDAILRHLKRKLKDKRFLLVLDDVWEHNRTMCNNLKSHLLSICYKTGNFVILTTRKLDVAKAMDTQDEHLVALKELEDRECWDIIREKCVMQWGGSMPEDLEEIGVEVARKCKGVPLAAKVVGGTLCKKKSREEWLSIQNSDAWDQIDEDNQIFPILKLSFHHLDPHVKQCFVYCSVFPKDFEYDTEKLIKLWMAEGFLNAGSSVKSMEDVGDECLNGLVVHSFFQDVEVDEWGNVMRCKMHDLLHDLATSVSNYKMSRFKDKIRCFVRTSNHQHHSSAEGLEMGEARNVRSIISFNSYDRGHMYSLDGGDFSHMFSTFKSLRSLDLSGAQLPKVSSAIGGLKHLRYLNVADNQNEDVKEVPISITKLYNLQTLRIINCWGIRILPANITNLLRLRHLHFDYPHLKIYKLGRLSELRTLPYFEVRAEEGYGIEELNKLNELRGKLTISSLENVRDREQAKRANLKDKKVTELNLEWSELHSVDENHSEENVLEDLLPPPTIKKLTIMFYKGVKFPNWISNSQSELTQLVELSLDTCVKCEIMPTLSHLRRLKVLNIARLHSISRIGGEFYGECKRNATLFPELKKLSVGDMNSLQQWQACEDTSVEVFPSLKVLKIYYCRRLESFSFRHLSSLVSLSIDTYDDMEYLSNDIQNLPSLNALGIGYCRSLVSLSSLDLKSLKYLHIWNCLELTSLPEDLVSLRVLDISKCPKLTSIPHWIKSCTSLLKLCIVNCQGLKSIDDDITSSLNALTELRLGPFSEELEEFPGLNSIPPMSRIEKLELGGWLKLKSLPQQIQHLTLLKELSIIDFKGLETLPDWLANLSSLESLTLIRCENLKNLPTPIKSLYNLTSLRCYGCPFLTQRYNKETGPDRHDISHIARVDFD